MKDERGIGKWELGGRWRDLWAGRHGEIGEVDTVEGGDAGVDLVLPGLAVEVLGGGAFLGQGVGILGAMNVIIITRIVPDF